MKKLSLATAMLGMSALLTACPGVDPPPSTSTLTVNLTGVNAAPVKVTNTTSGAVLWNDTVTGTKSFAGLPAGSVVQIEGGAVNGFTTPDSQSATMNGNKTVVLAYTALAGQAPSATVISGKVTGNTLKIGNAYLRSDRNPFYIKGSVDTDNVLTLNLGSVTPSGADLLTGMFQGCSGTNSHPQAGVFFAYLPGAFSPQGEYIGQIAEFAVSGSGVTADQTLVYRIYSTADWTFKGSCSFTDDAGKQGKEDIDISVKQGWNLMMTTLSASGLNQTTRNVAADVRTVLRFLRADPSVAALLNPSELSFSTDAPVTVDADFLQIGGYSGQVKLSTDRPGLTVEPNTVTLPALPAISAQAVAGRASVVSQALRPQALRTQLTFRYTGTENYTGAFTLKVTDSAGKEVGTGDGRLTVQRPGINLSYLPESLSLAPSSTISIPVCVYSVGGFSGDVTFSAQTLPAGVTVTPATVALSGNNSACGQIVLTSTASLVAGTYPITITATSAGKSARAPINIVVPAPAVSISVSNSYAPVNVYRGSDSSVEVSLSSINGFNGQTTLSLQGLPAGISATAKTVSVAPNAATVVKIPLTASTDATLGAVSVSVTSPDAGPSYGQNTFQLNVAPQRSLVGTIAGSPTRAGSGVWLTTGGSFDYTTGRLTSDIQRFVEGASVARVTLDNLSGARLVARRTGGVLALASDSSGSSYAVSEAGVATALSTPFEYNDTFASATDAQGRVWFIDRSDPSSSTVTAVLSHWNPTTGKVTAVDGTRNYESSSSGEFALSEDGETLVFLASYSNTAVRVKTATGVVSTLDLSGNAQSLSVAIQNDGTIWFSNYSQLKRLNADDTITVFTSFTVPELTGFDQASSTTLWGTDYAGVVKIDTSTVTATLIRPGGSPSGAATLSGGGLSVLTNEYDSSGVYKYYLSTLR